MTSPRTLAKRVVALPFSWTRPLRHIPSRWVLTFHEVGDHPWATSPDQFATIVLCLRDAAEVVPLADLLGESSASSVPRIGITFDDGYAGIVRHALPVLAGASLPATVFLPTDLVSDVDGPPPQDRGLYAGRPLMGWGTVRALAASSIVTFESHGASHRSLRTMDAAGRGQELRRSREAIRAATGRAPRFLAYPFGAADPETAAAVRESGYEAAFTTRHGGLREGADRFLLPRADVRADYGARDVLAILRGDWDFLSLAQGLRGPRA